MSFATRCTACGTIFRVVQDQLRVSEGWVRCGRCAEVFDAREQLFDIDRDPPPVWAGDAAPAAAVFTAAAVHPVDQSQGSDTRAEVPVDFAPPSVVARNEPQSPVPQPSSAHIPAVLDSRARHEPQWEEDMGGAVEGWGISAAAETGLQSTDRHAAAPGQPQAVDFAESLASSIAAVSTVTSGPAELPSFMRQSSRAASRWQRSGVRLMMAGLTVLLAIALALQLLLHFRDATAAVYPQALPALQALCQASGCKVLPWRRIEALSVENSALTQAGSQAGGSPSNRYQLTLSLHNKSGVTVAAPAIELSLLDSGGAVVLRRVLKSDDFRKDRGGTATSVAIAPGADLPMQLLLTTGARRISGYSVEIFHP